MAALLNSSSVMMCPHGGTVTAITTNTKAKAGGDFILRSSDIFIIAGCPFTIGPNPHPCVQVQWVQPDTRSQVMSDFTLSEASVGLCVAPDQAVQGTVLVNSTQPKVSGI
jgi:hypothetical protein